MPYVSEPVEINSMKYLDGGIGEKIPLDKPFEEGGGYKINFGGDAIFQYHPAEKSHHGGAYWKIHQGKVEHRYDMAGNEKQDG